MVVVAGDITEGDLFDIDLQGVMNREAYIAGWAGGKYFLAETLL
jgi:hypothetical protein